MVDFDTLNILINMAVPLCFFLIIFVILLISQLIISIFVDEKSEKEKSEKEKSEKIRDEFDYIYSEICSIKCDVDNLYSCKSDKRSKRK